MFEEEIAELMTMETLDLNEELEFYYDGKRNALIGAQQEVQKKIDELKERLKNENKLWGFALIERKETGKTAEHCFDGFFRNLNKDIDEIFTTQNQENKAGESPSLNNNQATEIIKSPFKKDNSKVQDV